MRAAALILLAALASCHRASAPETVATCRGVKQRLPEVSEAACRQACERHGESYRRCMEQATSLEAVKECSPFARGEAAKPRAALAAQNHERDQCVEFCGGGKLECGALEADVCRAKYGIERRTTP